MIKFDDYQSLLSGGVQKTIDKYGILNIIDYWFDKYTKVDDPSTPEDESEINPFKLDNDGVSNGLYTYFLNAWDVLKNIDKEEKNKIKAYYYSAKDMLNYLSSFNKTIIRKLEISDNQTYKKYLTELYEYYSNRKVFSTVKNIYSSKQNIEVWMIKIDKDGNYIDYLPENADAENGMLWNTSLFRDFYGKNFGIKKDGNYVQKKIYCVQLTKEKIENGFFLNNDGEEGFIKWKTRIVEDKSGKKTKEIKKTYFFFLKPDYYVDHYGEFVEEKSIIYELLSAIVESFQAYEKGEYKNYYEEFFKQYFYNILLEKYRTKEIEEEFLKYISFDLGFFKGIPNLNRKMDGKTFMNSFGTLVSKNDGHKYSILSDKTLVYNQQYAGEITIPFVKSEYNEGFVSFYIEAQKLPKGFNLIKQYRSIEEYLIFVKNFYLKLRNKTRKDLEFDAEKNEFKETLKTVYKTQAEYIDERLAGMANRKLRELLYTIKPTFNLNLEDETLINQKAGDTLVDILKYCNGKDFDVGDIIINDSNIVYALEFFKDTAKKVNYAKITVSNNLIKDFYYLDGSEDEDGEPIKNRYINLGGGYITIQQKATFSNDTLRNEYSHDDYSDSYTTIDGKKYITNDLDSYKEVKKILENRNETYETRKEMDDNIDFSSILDDSEITITHKVCGDIGYKENKISEDIVTQEWVYGKLGEDGKIEEEYLLPNWKKSVIFCDYNEDTGRYEYSINFQNMHQYDTPETIKQIKVIDFDSGIKYKFPVKGVSKRTLMQEDNLLELDNLFEFDKEYVANDTLYLFIRDGLNTGNFKISKNTYGVNEIVIQNETAEYSRIVGDTLVVGNEYETSLGKLTLDEDGTDGYCLTLTPKDENSSTNVVYQTKFITKKRLIIKPYSDVDEYLETIPKGGKKTVYIDSFIQAEGASKDSNIYIDDFE